jgi:Putative Actinobacterial Holin-X, holin superfamily III
MAQTETPRPAASDQSIGDLVALAAKDVSQLIHYEMDLAKSELRGDVRRIGMAAVLGGVAAFTGCLMLILLCFAYAYALMEVVGWSGWLSFLVVAGTCLLLILAAVLIAYVRVRGVSGLRITRASVRDSIAALRRSSDQPEITGPAQQ